MSSRAIISSWRSYGRPPSACNLIVASPEFLDGWRLTTDSTATVVPAVTSNQDSARLWRSPLSNNQPKFLWSATNSIPLGGVDGGVLIADSSTNGIPFMSSSNNIDRGTSSINKPNKRTSILRLSTNSNASTRSSATVPQNVDESLNVAVGSGRVGATIRLQWTVLTSSAIFN